MTMPDPRSPAGRFMAWCLLLVLLGGLGLIWLGGAMTRLDNARASLRDTLKLTQRYSDLAAQAGLLAAALAEAEQATGWRTAFLDSANPAIAGAQLQRLAADTAQDLGLAIGRLEVQTQVPGIADAVALRVAVQGGYNALMEMLAALESGEPRLMIRDVTITPVLSHGRVQPGQAPRFAVQMAIIGLIAPEQP